MIRAVLLDIDGTIIDSNDGHAKAWMEACRLQGITVDFARVRRLIGIGGDHLTNILIGANADSSAGRKLIELQQKIFIRDHLPSVRPFPGARELLLKFKSEGLTIESASSSEKNILTELLKRARVQDIVGTAVLNQPGLHSKPCPDIIAAALDATGATAKEAVMIGDTPYDIEAASRVDVRTIAFLCGGWRPEALTGAISIYRDPLDLLQNFGQSWLSKSRKPAQDVPFPLN